MYVGHFMTEVAINLLGILEGAHQQPQPEIINRVS